MSAFWSGWVIALLVLNLGVAIFLFVWAQVVHIPTEPDGTTGHVWAHGVLRESVRRLPLWWVIISVVGLLAGFIYLALYPGFGGFKGILGWTSADEWQQETTALDTLREQRMQPWRSLSLEQLAAIPEATSIGHRLYLDNCAACHGPEAFGNHAVGAPNLRDAEWLYGGDSQSILTSILDGRQGVMPAWGSALGYDGANEAAAYVLSLSGTDAPKEWVAAGKPRYDAMCVACHGPDGRGNPSLGAPSLVDAAWLYGGDFASIATSIRNGRNGAMPAWRQRLGEDRVRTIAAWLMSQRAPAPKQTGE